MGLKFYGHILRINIYRLAKMALTFVLSLKVKNDWLTETERHLHEIDFTEAKLPDTVTFGLLIDTKSHRFSNKHNYNQQNVN